MQRTVNPCRKTMWERYPPDQPCRGLVKWLSQRTVYSLSRVQILYPWPFLLKKNVLLLCSVTASTMGSGPINLRSNRSREAEHSLICGAAG